jgi:hypothetical protein
MDAVNVKKMTGDSYCFFSSLDVLLENDESQYDGATQKAVTHVFENWNKFKQDGGKSK